MLSVLVPVHDERDTLEPLLTEIRAACAGRSYEVLFIDDGSGDGSSRVLEGLHRRWPGEVRVLTLGRRRGKAAALAAGLQTARGGLILTLDGDGQDDPGELPRLLSRIEEGYDLVCGWRRARRDSLWRTVPSRIYNRLMRLVSGLPLWDFNCGLRLYRRRVVEKIAPFGSLYRYLPLLAHREGFTVGQAPVRHRPRRLGRSKYGAVRLLLGPMDLLAACALTRLAQPRQRARDRLAPRSRPVPAALGVARP